MSDLIKRQDAINVVMQNYCCESERMTALQELPTITETGDRIREYGSPKKQRLIGGDNLDFNGGRNTL